MEKVEVFRVLGIEPTRDEAEIKKAYREKLVNTKPEEDPEGFKKLRAAFEEANRLAQQEETEEKSESETEEEKDVTPSGLWVEKAAQIYGDIESRRNVDCWSGLFEEDIFLSLEEEENCTFKLLRFLMEHYRLPADVWKLFDARMNIVSNASRLREHFPVDFINFIVSKCERGEDVNFDLFEGEKDAPYDQFLYYYEQCYRALEAEDIEQAEECIKKADETQITHPVMEVCRAGVLEKQGKVQEALSLLISLKEKYSEDTMVCYSCAETLWRNGEREKAVAIYKELKAENDSHYMANVRLTEWYYEQQRFQDAKKCAERVIALGSDDAFMELLKKINYELEKNLEGQYRKNHDWETALELGWCYLQDGRGNAGIRLVLENEDRIPQDRRTEYNGLLTKLYTESAEYEKCIDMSKIWEASLLDRIEKETSEEEKEKDRDRLRQAHLIRMQCYRALAYKDESYYQKILDEAKLLEDGTARDIEVWMEQAQIYQEMGEYDKSLEICTKLIEEYQVYAAYACAMETGVRQRDAQCVVRNGKACIHFFPNFARAYERVGRVYLDLEYTEELKELLAEAKHNGIKCVFLEAYEYQISHEIPDNIDIDHKVAAFRKEYLDPLEEGHVECYEKGLPIITEYLYQYSGSYMLVERAIFHRAAHHYQEAIADYEKALIEVPSNPYALKGLALVYRYMGDFEKALVYMKKAVLYMKDDMSETYADLARIYLLLGDGRNALGAYRKYIEKNGWKNAFEVDRMAECIASLESPQEAREALLKVHKSGSAEFFRNLIPIYQCTGYEKEAQAGLEEWEKHLNKGDLLLPAALHTKKMKKKANEYADYYMIKAWNELMYGDREKAYKFCKKGFSFIGEDDERNLLAESVYICILANKPKQGKKCARALQNWIRKMDQEESGMFYDSEKWRLKMEFLCNWYTEDNQVLEKILDRDKTCELCHHCSGGMCRVEMMKVLYLLRIGKEKEAKILLENCRRKEPSDAYLLVLDRSITFTQNDKKSVERL